MKRFEKRHQFLAKHVINSTNLLSYLFRVQELGGGEGRRYEQMKTLQLHQFKIPLHLIKGSFCDMIITVLIQAIRLFVFNPLQVD